MKHMGILLSFALGGCATTHYGESLDFQLNNDGSSMEEFNKHTAAGSVETSVYEGMSGECTLKITQQEFYSHKPTPDLKTTEKRLCDAIQTTYQTQWVEHESVKCKESVLIKDNDRNGEMDYTRTSQLCYDEWGHFDSHTVRIDSNYDGVVDITQCFESNHREVVCK